MAAAWCVVEFVEELVAQRKGKRSGFPNKDLLTLTKTHHKTQSGFLTKCRYITRNQETEVQFAGAATGGTRELCNSHNMSHLFPTARVLSHLRRAFLRLKKPFSCLPEDRAVTPNVGDKQRWDTICINHLNHQSVSPLLRRSALDIKTPRRPPQKKIEADQARQKRSSCKWFRDWTHICYNVLLACRNIEAWMSCTMPQPGVLGEHSRSGLEYAWPTNGPYITHCFGYDGLPSNNCYPKQ